ncbi:MAG: HAMP domain-containing sensor histidine kinase [Acidimicrobiales bacterium]
MTAGAAIALLSHELATPLSVLEGWAGLLATTTDPDEREPAIDAMCRAARQISTVLDLVRDTAAADGDRLPIDARATWLREPIAEAVAGCADRFSHAIEVDVADVAVPLDARRFTAALGNVLANVAKHVGREAVVRIVTVERDRVIELHVIDDGPGVPLDKLGVIFRRFGRANRRVAGTGLGLYVARAIARAHQGDLRYRRATPSGGADFVFELPLHAR